MLAFKENKMTPITAWLKIVLCSYLLSLQNRKKRVTVTTTEMHDVHLREENLSSTDKSLTCCARKCGCTDLCLSVVINFHIVPDTSMDALYIYSSPRGHMKSTRTVNE